MKVKTQSVLFPLGASLQDSMLNFLYHSHKITKKKKKQHLPVKSGADELWRVLTHRAMDRKHQDQQELHGDIVHNSHYEAL